MKRTGNKSIKIIAATSMAIFSLLATFSATFAWFTAMRKTAEETDNFNVTPTSGAFKKMTFHDIVHASNTTLQFKKDYWGKIELVNPTTKQLNVDFYEDATAYDMGKYDYLEKSHPVLLLIELNNDDGDGVTASAQQPVVVKATTETTYFIGDGASPLYSQDDVEADLGINPLSSVVTYSSVSYATDSALESIESSFSDTETYAISKSSLTDYGSFVQFTDEEYTGFNSEISVFSASTGTVKYIALVFDYYELAVETIYNQYIGDSILDDELLFTCDWTLVI